MTGSLPQPQDVVVACAADTTSWGGHTNVITSVSSCQRLFLDGDPSVGKCIRRTDDGEDGQGTPRHRGRENETRCQLRGAQERRISSVYHLIRGRSTCVRSKPILSNSFAVAAASDSLNPCPPSARLSCSASRKRPPGFSTLATSLSPRCRSSQ